MLNEIPEYLWALLAVLILAMYSWAADGEMQDELDEQALYCKMTAMYEASGGENGWPDYRGQRKQLCGVAGVKHGEGHSNEHP